MFTLLWVDVPVRISGGEPNGDNCVVAQNLDMWALLITNME